VSCEPSWATWLPQGWRAGTFPIGWTLAHLERWFDHAIAMAQMGTGPYGSEQRSIPLDCTYPPGGRVSVEHAHLIVHHLGLTGCHQEPRVAMDQAGCVAELRAVRRFLQQALSERPPTPSPTAPAGGPATSDPPARSGRGLTKIAKALAVLCDHPEWTNEQIAAEVQCNVKYLSQSAQFRAARHAIRELGRRQMTRLPRPGRQGSGDDAED
jgi:hypothetical protein